MIGIPVTVLLVAVTLIAIARPDPDDGPYAAYLALASLLSIYLLLLALTATGEALGQHLVMGDDDPFRSDIGSVGSLSIYYSLFTTGGAARSPGSPPSRWWQAGRSVPPPAPRGAARRRPEADRRAHRPRLPGAVCFAMVSLALVAALVAGAAGYTFFSQPVSIANGDRIRDLAMGSLLSYGGLVLVAGLVFRANVWAIRGNDEAPDDDVTLAEMGDA